ncbi:hypothetical protein MZM54_01495 [[Brevibacterium] frigoritolerans]|nr:hypothetical protein [Peribacillus frigoritolerans]
MKGRFKDRIKQITLIVLFLIISVLTISLISGRITTQEILILKKDGINTLKPLDQQLEFFEKKEILKSEIKYFKGSVVTEPTQLKDKRLLFELKAGSPIPLSALVEPKGAGQFAAVMPKGRTVYLLPEAKLGLPPVQDGDLINIALSYKEKDDSGSEEIRVGLLLTDVKIYKIVENSIFLDVNIEQSMVLSAASQLGSFVYQIPGQKDEVCSDEDCVTDETVPTVIHQSDIFDAILNKKYAGVKGSDIIDSIEDPISGEEISKNIVNPEEDEKETNAKTDSEQKESDKNATSTGGDKDGE